MILITFLATVALIIGNIYFSNPGNRNPKSDFYLLGNKKLYSGSVNISDDQKTAIVIGKLIYVNAKEAQVIGKFDFQGSRNDIIVYSPDLPTNLAFQNSQNISPSQINPRIQSQGALDSQNKALSTLGKLQGQVVVLTFLLKDKQINKHILECNSQFVNNLLGDTQIPSCNPQTFLISAYRPNFNIFSLISGFGSKTSQNSPKPTKVPSPSDITYNKDSKTWHIQGLIKDIYGDKISITSGDKTVKLVKNKDTQCYRTLNQAQGGINSSPGPSPTVITFCSDVFTKVNVFRQVSADYSSSDNINFNIVDISLK